MKILGIDPGLQKTGWGLIDSQGNALHFVACGHIRTDSSRTLAERLLEIGDGLNAVVQAFLPDESAIEETFMNNNAASALKLGCARGAAMLSVARSGLGVFEYPATLVKKAVVGNGHATKDQIGMMIKVLLPASDAALSDEADALAVAICHAHHAQTRARAGGIMAGGSR